MSEAITTTSQPNLARQEWIDRRNTVVETARGYAAINDDNVADAVGEVIQKLQKLTKQLDDARKDLTRPLDAAKKQLTNQQKELAAPIEAEYTRLRGMLGDYATRKAAEREEAERAARQAEAEARLLAEEEARKAAEEAQKCAAAIEDVFGVKPAEQLPPPPVSIPVPAPTPIIPEKTIVAGMKQGAVITWEITNPNELDRKFLSPDDKKIRAFADDIKRNGLDPEAIIENGIVFHKEIRMDVK